MSAFLSVTDAESMNKPLHQVRVAALLILMTLVPLSPSFSQEEKEETPTPLAGEEFGEQRLTEHDKADQDRRGQTKAAHGPERTICVRRRSERAP